MRRWGKGAPPCTVVGVETVTTTLQTPTVANLLSLSTPASSLHFLNQLPGKAQARFRIGYRQHLHSKPNLWDWHEGIILRQFQVPESLESWRDRESPPDIDRESPPDITVLSCRSLCPFIHIPSQETSRLIILLKAHCATSAVFSRHPSFSLAIFEITFQAVC